MPTTPRTVPMHEFARAMRDTAPAFAARVRRFEQRFGPVDDDTLAVLAQASHACWHNVRYRENLLELCRAVRQGRPTSLFYHCQLGPRRWIEINTVVVGVRKWLGEERPVPQGVSAEKVERIGRLLGEPHPAREALAELFLANLADDLLNYVSFTVLAAGPEEGADEYPDFSPWYVRPDGGRYAVGHPLAPSDGHRWTWQNEAMAGFRRACAERARRAMADRPEEAEGPIRRLSTLSQPPCMHRFTRYLDVQLASIGALEWRGRVPPDDGGKRAWQAFREEAQAALEAWLEGRPPRGALADQIHRELGPPSDRKRAVVRDFLLAGNVDEGEAWDWLMARTEAEGTSARGTFEEDRP